MIGGVKDAERIMQRAHRNGAALIDRFDSLNDTYAFEPAYDTYAKLNDRGLNVAFVPVPADDGDDERLEALAELRDMAEIMDAGADILNEDRHRPTSTAPAKVIFGAVSLVTAFIGVSLALIEGLRTSRRAKVARGSGRLRRRAPAYRWGPTSGFSR